MRVLVLGGTGFIGGHIARELVAGGHEVSVLSRGREAGDLPGAIQRLTGDREAADHGVTALRGGTWDACVDTSGYLPRSVQASVTALPGIRRYVFVSAVAAYGDPPRGPVTEDHPLTPLMPDDAVDRVDEIDNSTYGPFKARCEQIVEQAFGNRATILRPQVVTGPGDPSGRYTFWLARAARPGPTPAPGAGTDFLQVIDVRDVARFTRQVLERDLGGVFNLAGPRLTWSEFMRVIGAPDPVWISPAQLDAAGLPLSKLPLYRPAGSVRANLMHVSSEKAQAAGLTLTDPAVTAHDTRPTALGLTHPDALSEQEETALLQAASRS